MTVGQSGVFHVHLGDAVLFQKRLIGFVKRGELHNLHILRLGACGLGVTEIEEIISLLGSEQQCAVCGRERREVIEVRFGNDQRRFLLSPPMTELVRRSIGLLIDNSPF